MADLAAVGAVTAMCWGRLRQWIFTWGADDDEVTRVLPGDELVVDGAPRTTRALSIDAPTAMVWPWLAQIGEDRGGFYSYSWLERVVGAHIRNADTVHPEWQDISVGDTVWLARRYGDVARQVVAKVKPRSHLILTSPGDLQRIQHGEMASGSWGFHLSEQDGWTRLIVRGSGGPVGHALFDIPHFVMEQKMMRGIRQRAERARRDKNTAYIRNEYRVLQRAQRGLASTPGSSSNHGA